MLKIPQSFQSSKKTALIDGDIITYRVGFACESPTYFLEEEGEILKFSNKTSLKHFMLENKVPEVDEDGQQTWWQVEREPSLIEAIVHCAYLIDSILENTESSNYKLFLTGKDNFRDKIATTVPYKGNREGRKPKLYSEIREHLVMHKGAIVINGMEADDAMSLNQTDSTVICSIDKDLDMVPGEHYNFVKETGYMISEHEGMHNFFIQVLTGDATDNIQGIPKVGSIKAQRILAGCQTEEEYIQAVTAAYVEYFEDEDLATSLLAENASLLWMLRRDKECPIG